MNNPEVMNEINRARQTALEFEKAIVGKPCQASGVREVLLMGYWALTFDYDGGILTLLSSELFGSAFALLRPLEEAVLRAHLALKGTEREIAAIQKDKYRVDFTTIGKRLDAAFELERLIETFLDDARDALHSYTHSGMLQIGRRFRDDAVKPNYRDGDIIDLINVTTCGAFMVTNLVTKHFKFEEDWKRATQVFAEWGKKS